VIVDHIIVVSCQDKHRFIEKYHIYDNKITVIPSGTNIVNIGVLKDRGIIREKFGFKPDEIIILFHGTYTYTPNKEAIDFIVNYIAPEFEKFHKNVKFIMSAYRRICEGKDLSMSDRRAKKNLSCNKAEKIIMLFPNASKLFQDLSDY
jgi:hypothetical protein